MDSEASLSLSVKTRSCCLHREILDQQDGVVEDDGLTGLLRLSTSVLKHKPQFKFSREGQEFLRDVHNLLFLLPSLSDRSQPKCKSHSARAAAYDLLVETVRGSGDNYRLLHNWVMAQHLQTSHAPYKWDYWPHDDVRAECRFVGLTNLGATCYLASTIQQLYMIPEARQAVFTAKLALGLGVSTVPSQCRLHGGLKHPRFHQNGPGTSFQTSPRSLQLPHPSLAPANTTKPCQSEKEQHNHNTLASPLQQLPFPRMPQAS
uniref:Peptidase C19 ubiquitin carboxyl-terminal hydrolase domain-containing protein n=1 Tax=Knipowitschia caucasica TaxID=637954 RepID=A0AAV2MFU8_KNICA